MNNLVKIERYQKSQNVLKSINHLLDKQNKIDFSLFNGLAGELLFKAQGSRDLSLIESDLERCISAVRDENMLTSLCSGFTGIAWLINKLFYQYPDLFTNDPTEEMDVYIHKSGILAIKSNNWDYLHGGLGHIFYLIEKYENKNNSDLKELIEKLLIELFDRLSLMLNFKKSKLETQNIQTKLDCGMAHGLLSLFAIFVKAHECGIYKETTKIFSNKIFQVYCSIYKKELFSEYFLPNRIEKTKFEMPNRLGWCYGDLIAGYTFLKSGHVLNDPDMKTMGNEILQYHSKRFNLEKLKHNELGLCHGIFGVSLIYSEAFKLTNTWLYKTAHELWYFEGLKRIEKAIEINDFSCGTPNVKNINASFIDGLSGIGLVITDKITNVKDDAWKKLLLL